MSIYRGFVRSLEVRGDGWAEFVLQAVHSGNGSETFYISNLDGDILTANRRLAHLSLLRDAIARTLPVEVEYDSSDERGNVVEDLTIYHRPSFDGRRPGRRIEGVVIGVMVIERGPESAASPYVDEADLAAVTLLLDDGSLEQAILDLQRPDTLSAQTMFQLIKKAHRTRRPIALLLDSDSEFHEKPGGGRDVKRAAAASTGNDAGVGYIVGCEYEAVPERSLDYTYCFVERLGQRYESYESESAAELSNTSVIYTTAPSQTPEGDVSDNGTFAPETREAWVHSDSPLLKRLENALRNSFQVKIGLDDRQIHEVVVVGHMGSAARPVWIKIDRVALEPETEGLCNNTPTIVYPDTSDFNEIPHAVAWRGEGYFNEGIWRFSVRAGGDYRLTVDGKPVCCEIDKTDRGLAAGFNSLEYSSDVSSRFESRGRSNLCHAYLNGIHKVEIALSSHTCSKPFNFQAYRIR